MRTKKTTMTTTGTATRRAVLVCISTAGLWAGCGFDLRWKERWSWERSGRSWPVTSRPTRSRRCASRVFRGPTVVDSRIVSLKDATPAGKGPGNQSAALFALHAGEYTVAATALDADGLPVADCMPTTTTATVAAGRTTELTLGVLCVGAGIGAFTNQLQIILPSLSAPVITGVSLRPTGTIVTGQPVNLAVFATASPGATPLAYRWALASSPTRVPPTLVGAPSRSTPAGLALMEAYSTARREAPGLLLGGIAIAERHARRNDEHMRILAKTAEGCRFFVTQAVYDLTATKSLLSDYALALRQRNETPVPIILTFSPCGSEKTLAFMKWLGIHFPRWLENDLREARDPLATSMELCERIFSEAWDYARDKGLPLGVNVESVSIRKVEIEASHELLRRLQRRMAGGGRH